ncbi:MAG TPA: ABC-F type ribosomal protection protein [Phototrophicaceae bacterium]|nr:ABC-F type ribosomal protection protein [Phototrophicaceae bacterium]
MSYTYLTISNITKTYGYHDILNGVSLLLTDTSRIGLVGANGVGKSTLLKIVTGEVEPDSGEVTLAVGRRLGYLAQTMRAADGHSLADLITESQAHLYAMETRLRELETCMTALVRDELDAVLVEYGDLTDAFERFGGYELEARVDAVLDGLGVAHLSRDREFSTFSGGEKSRIGLALLLLQAPDVLLLDEPTNHLDWRSLTWLETYLSSYRGALLIVSHDRQFLNSAINAIVEIDEHTRTTRRYTGNYDAYYAAKVLERQKWEADYTAQEEEIRRLRLEMKEVARRNDNYRAHTDNDKFVRNFKIAQHDDTISKRVRVAQEKLNRIMENPILEPPDELYFRADFDTEGLHGRYPLTVEELTKSYGSRSILEHVTFTLHATSRIALVGENGAGKSTLLRVLMGDEVADSGHIYFSPAVRVGYLDQENRTLDPAKSVFEAYADGLHGTEQQLKSILLRSGLFQIDDLDKRAGELSIGQQRKLQIARLMVGKANFLILDEPTNHVSFDVLEGLEAALKSFPGPILAATHDRHFLEIFGGEIWEVKNGAIIPYLGGYQEYLAAQTIYA